jgi:ABC-type branched-subunit amino acid transport system ATPase component
MLKSLKIENFRCFQTFELQQFGRVNLLVGNNNSGKTSILEAIQLLHSRNNLEPLADAMDRRGEYFWGDGKNGFDTRREFDISHLFYGHQVQAGKSFSISGINNDLHEKVSASVVESSMSQAEDIKYTKSRDWDNVLDRLGGFNLLLRWILDAAEEPLIRLPLETDNGLPRNALRHFSGSSDKKFAKNHFITSSSLTVEKMTELFEQVVLTPEEELVYEALQTIEPNIERIASVGSKKYRNAERGGFVVRFSDNNQRVPIGSMGDGIWRMLGITLAIVNTRDGVLLADEIDTGLHFSVMSDMWKLIWETAKRLNVQVFATTHNSDCWTSLAAITNTENDISDGITIQRVERGKSMSVIFNERQMAIAAERGIEVR